MGRTRVSLLVGFPRLGSNVTKVRHEVTLGSYVGTLRHEVTSGSFVRKLRWEVSLGSYVRKEHQKVGNYTLFLRPVGKEQYQQLF